MDFHSFDNGLKTAIQIGSYARIRYNNETMTKYRFIYFRFKEFQFNVRFLNYLKVTKGGA